MQPNKIMSFCCVCVCLEKQEEQELNRLQCKWHICTLRTVEVWNSVVGPLEMASTEFGES